MAFRQTLAAVADVHVPVPFSHPQALSTSHTLLTHTAAAAAASHVPVRGGECPAIEGRADPWLNLATHRLVCGWQNSDVAQSPSARHPGSGRHAPRTEQAPD